MVALKRHKILQLENFLINPMAFLSVREHSILCLLVFNSGVMTGILKDDSPVMAIARFSASCDC